MKIRRIGFMALTAALAVGTLSACGSDSSEAVKTDANQKVTIDFWGWAPGYKEAVDLWNKTHPNTQVKFTQTENTDKVYTKMFTAVEAGNAPCLGQVEYGALPNFKIQDALMDTTKYTSGMDKEFTADAWKQTVIAGQNYGVPVDTAPIAFIYRKDIFDKNGWTAPKTWEEYRELAKKVKEKDPSMALGYYSNDSNWNAALARQKGAKWFELGSDSWKVNINDKATKEVGDFWQGMINDGLIKAEESYTPALYKQMADGKILSEAFGIWDTAVIAQSVADTAGKWAVAPMPTWKDDPGNYVSAGGSATVVFKGCKYPDRAVEFAHWMSTDAKSVEQLIEKGGLWPASLKGLESPQLDKAVPFYGNQKIYEPFKEISKNMKFEWTWGPLQNQVNKDITDMMPKVSKDNTINSNWDKIQKKAVADIKAKNMKVSE